MHEHAARVHTLPCGCMSIHAENPHKQWAFGLSSVPIIAIMLSCERPVPSHPTSLERWGTDAARWDAAQGPETRMVARFLAPGRPSMTPPFEKRPGGWSGATTHAPRPRNLSHETRWSPPRLVAEGRLTPFFGFFAVSGPVFGRNRRGVGTP